MDTNEDVIPSGTELPTPIPAVPPVEVSADEEEAPAAPSGGGEEDPADPIIEDDDGVVHVQPSPEELIDEATADIVHHFEEVVVTARTMMVSLSGKLLEDFSHALHMAEAGLRVFGVEPGQVS